MLRAFEDVNEMYSAQHFVTFWRNIHSKLMLKMCLIIYFIVLCAMEMSSYSADSEAALVAWQ